MKTELFTVSKIFNEILYRIPDYQRGYSWEAQHLKDFWLDIEQLELGKSHYTGVLTLEPIPETVLSTKDWTEDAWIVKSKKFQPYFVVDGQQRLTTIVIFIQTLLELPLPAKLNHTSIADIRRKYIYDSKDDNSRSYIFGYVVDNPSYEYLKTKIFNEQSTIHSAEEATIYTKNLRNAKTFFAEKLSGLNPVKLEEVFTKVTQQLVFNVYEIAKEIDVFVTFETMNNRGKLLSNLELIKNRLIYLAMKMGPDEAEALRLRHRINEAWKTIYHYLGKNENRPLDDDTFLRTHLSHYFFSQLVKFPEDDDERNKLQRQQQFALESVGRFLLNDVFTQKRLKISIPNNGLPALTPNFVETYAQDLKNSVSTYYKISTPSDSAFSDPEKVYLERIGRLRGHNPNPMLLSVYCKEKDAKKRAAFLDVFEHLSFLITLKNGNGYHPARMHLMGMDLNQYSGGVLTIDEVITTYENSVTEMIKELPMNEVLTDWVKVGQGYYSWRSIKYFLFEYEHHLMTGSKTSRVKIDWDAFCGENFQSDYDTIEHIYPQKARDSYWTDKFGKFSPTQKRLIRNSLGNLLALSRPKNASLSNKAFLEKKGKPGGSVGYLYGSYSENAVATLADWGPQEVLNRGIKMLEFMEFRWNFQIGDIKQKARALGLEFLIK